MRMDRDAKAAAFGNAAQRGLRQVFIARSRALCAQVRRMVETGGHNAAATTSLSMVDANSSASQENSSAFSAANEFDEDIEEENQPSAQFVTIDEFVRIVEDTIDYRINEDEVKPTWDLTTQVRWKEFEKDFWPSLSKYSQRGLGGKDEKAQSTLKKNKTSKGSGGGGEEEDKPLVPLMVWTQIRSLLKGSVEAANGCEETVAAAEDEDDDDNAGIKRLEIRPAGTPMSREEYMQLIDTRCPLTPKQRSAAYEYFEMYQDWLKKGNRWDDMDRVLVLIKKLKSRARKNSNIWKGKLNIYTIVYAISHVSFDVFICFSTIYIY